MNIEELSAELKRVWQGMPVKIRIHFRESNGTLKIVEATPDTAAITYVQDEPGYLVIEARQNPTTGPRG